MAFSGIWTALVTPFHSDGSVDFAAYERLLERQVRARVTGVIPCGTTGESPTLTEAERKKIIETAIHALKGTDVGVVAGTGSNSTSETVAFSRWASHLPGIRGILVVAPYYNKPTQAGLEAHFTAVADASNVPVMLYNVPGRTVVSIAPATVAKLARHPRIRAIKEATGDPAVTSEILRALRSQGASAAPSASNSFEILSGDDATFLSLMGVGACGNVSVASNIVPEEMVQMHAAAMGGDWATARSIHDRLFPIFKDLFVESNPGPVKHALEWLGLGSRRLRLPLVPLAEENARKLETSLEACGLRSGSWAENTKTKAGGK